MDGDAAPSVGCQEGGEGRRKGRIEAKVWVSVFVCVCVCVCVRRSFQQHFLLFRRHFDTIFRHYFIVGCVYSYAQSAVRRKLVTRRNESILVDKNIYYVGVVKCTRI